MRSTVARFMIAGILAAAFGGVAAAQDVFPSKTIELIVHRGGGSTYLGGRVVAEALQAAIGTPVVEVSKPAGGGSAAPTYASAAKPDGYTLLLANSGINGTLPNIVKVAYKNSDFEYLALYGTQPMVLVVKKDARWKTVKDLVDEAKKNPGKLKYSTSSFGAQSHFLMEFFKQEAGNIQIDQVPFKGAPQSVAALLGGHVDVASTYLVDVKGQLDAGTLRILAVPEKKRLVKYPDGPTFAESGYPNVLSTAWFGIAAPKGLPKDVAEKLKTNLYKAIKNPDTQKKLADIGYTPVFMNSDEFTKFVFDQQKVFSEIAKKAKIGEH